MQEIRTSQQFDIKDIDYIKKILRMLLFYPRKDINFNKFLRKMDEYWNLAIPEKDELYKVYKLAIQLATKERLQNKSLEIIRNNIINKLPILEDEILLWEKEEKFTDLRNEYEQIIKDLTSKFKIFAIFKFVVNFKRYYLDIENLEDVKSINTLIKEFQNDINIEPEESEIVLNDPDIIEEFIEQNILKYAESKDLKSVIPSSIATLNLIFSNLEGYEKSTLNILGSYIGAGKTTFLIKEAVESYLRGFNVIHITIENKEEEILNKIYASILGIPIRKLYSLYRNFYKDEEAKKKLKEIIQTIKDITTGKPNRLIVKKFPVKNTTVEDIRIYLDDISSNICVPDLVVIDHMDIVFPSEIKIRENENNLYNFGKQVSIEMKDLAEEFNTVLLTATQVNREGQKDINTFLNFDIHSNIQNNENEKNKKKRKNPFESFLHRGNISKSIAKVEYADTFITINKTPDENFLNLARIYVDKNRHGKDKLLIPIEFDLSKIDARAILDLNKLQSIYGDTPLIYKSLAYLFYTAVVDGNEILRKTYIDYLEQYLNYLNPELKPKAVEIIHKYKYQNNKKEPIHIDTSIIENDEDISSSINSTNIVKENRENIKFLTPSQFINEILKYLEDEDTYEIEDIQFDKNNSDILIFNILNKKTGEYTELRVSKSDLVMYKNQTDDEEIKEFIENLLL
jgi:hypothetical protein